MCFMNIHNVFREYSLCLSGIFIMCFRNIHFMNVHYATKEIYHEIFETFLTISIKLLLF